MPMRTPPTWSGGQLYEIRLFGRYERKVAAWLRSLLLKGVSENARGRHRVLWLRVSVRSWGTCNSASHGFLFLSVGCKFADEEFLKEVRDARGADSDECVFESQTHSITVTRRIVEIGDAASGEAS
jgi:hypothetical protein